MKILDTDHCVAFLRGKLSLDPHVRYDEVLGITTISLAELTHGAYKSKQHLENLTRLDILLSSLDIFPFDEGAARQFGMLKAALEQAGTPIHDLDLQIASIAITRGATLVTHNITHFQKVTGLDLEDWF